MRCRRACVGRGSRQRCASTHVRRSAGELLLQPRRSPRKISGKIGRSRRHLRAQHRCGWIYALSLLEEWSHIDHAAFRPDQRRKHDDTISFNDDLAPARDRHRQRERVPGRHHRRSPRKPIGSFISDQGRTIASGRTCLSKSAAEISFSAMAASLRVNPSACAFLATFAALS